jgi:hypothetical protein
VRAVSTRVVAIANSARPIIKLAKGMSAFSPIADIRSALFHARYRPLTELLQLPLSGQCGLVIVQSAVFWLVNFISGDEPIGGMLVPAIRRTTCASRQVVTQMATDLTPDFATTIWFALSRWYSQLDRHDV